MALVCVLHWWLNITITFISGLADDIKLKVLCTLLLQNGLRLHVLSRKINVIQELINFTILVSVENCAYLFTILFKILAFQEAYDCVH